MSYRVPLGVDRDYVSDDPCLVHQFIRLHGRRPTHAELVAFTAGPAAAAHAPPRRGPAVLARTALARIAQLLGRL